jgi:hypothetical protein
MRCDPYGVLSVASGEGVTWPTPCDDRPLRAFATVDGVTEPPLPGGLPPQPLPYGPNPVPPPDDPKSPSTLRILLIVVGVMIGIAVVCYGAAWLMR